MLPNSQQSNTGLLIFWENGESPKEFLRLKNMMLLLTLTEERWGSRDGYVTQAEGQLPDRTHPATIPMDVCSQRAD